MDHSTMIIYMNVYIHYQSKVFGYAKIKLFLIVKCYFFIKQIKRLSGFIYNTKYKSS